MIVKFRGSKDKGFLSRKIRVREFIIISNVLETFRLRLDERREIKGRRTKMYIYTDNR